MNKAKNNANAVNTVFKSTYYNNKYEKNYGEYHEVENYLKSEKGITLIVLIIMVVILIILAAVIVRGITGNESIIEASEETVESYQKEQRKEKIKELAESIIEKKSITGKTTNVETIANEMEEEEWINSLTAYQDGNLIIVKLTDGNEYAVYYDEETGKLEVEYIGEDDGSSIPTVTAGYNKETNQITATAKNDDGIEKIELIYKDEVNMEEEGEGSTAVIATFDISKTGWYKIKVTGSNGKTISTYIRVTSEIEAPDIEITSGGQTSNCETTGGITWYGKGKEAVEVTITASDTAVKGIYYTTDDTVTNDSYTYVEGTEKTLSINKVGVTKIRAYAVDEKGLVTKETVKLIRYDNVAPEAGAIEVQGTEGNNGWYKSNITITIKAGEDGTSGAKQIKYSTSGAKTIEETTTEEGTTSTSFTISEEGITTITAYTIDKAGNISATITKEISKDSLAPGAFTMTISDITGTSFKVSGGTTDDTTSTTDVSGIEKYNIYLEGSRIKTITDVDEGDVIEYEVPGLTANTSYTAYIEAIDKAGNTRNTKAITVSTED